MTPQPSTSRTAQSPLGEPSCKKAKMHGAGLPESLADSVSCDTMTVSQPEEDTHHTMSQLQAPGSVNSQNVNNVYLDMVQAWENPIRNFRAVEYYQRYRFINLDQIRSFVVAIEAIHNVIQILLNNVAMNIGPNDFVQLRLDAEGLNHPIFSHRRCMNDLNADDFLTSVENLLQSKAEILWGGDLQLVVTIVKNKEGGGLRKLNTLLLTKVLEKKRQHLVDFNVEGEFLCFASCLLCLIGSDGSKQEIITKARELHSKLGISTGNRIDFSQVHIFEKHLQVTIKILFYMQDGWRFFVTGHPQQEKIVFILLHDKHYYGVKNIKGFLGERYFCKFCHTAYHHKFSHGCQYICRACLKQECQQVEVEKGLCCRCKAPCRSKECAERHAQLAKEGKVECKTKQYCETCGLYVFTPHKKCKEVKCGQCSEKVESLEGHLCFLKSLDRPRIGERYIIYDFECCQETGTHIPNYACARDMLKDEDDKDVVRWDCYGVRCLEQFIKKFINHKFKGCTFIAHNSKGYDGYLVLRQLIREKVRVQLISQGGKLLCITLPDYKIRFIDSLSFLPLKLSKLPKAMGFQGCKGYFPHLFNTMANQDYVGPLPETKYYSPETMMPGEREEFLKWHTANRGTVFKLKKALAYYCRQDVDILREACIRFRDQVMKMTEREYSSGVGLDTVEEIQCIDPFQYITLASVCMAQYLFMYLKSNTIALDPLDNYHNTQKRYSAPAIQWLLYIEHTEKLNIQHALKGGEKKVGKYFLDGFAVINGTPTAFEFHGCFFHGCPVCYSEKDFNKLLDSTYGSLHSRTRIKEEYLRSQGYAVRCIWEHEWRAMVEEDTSLKQFLVENKLPAPLNPRDAFFGGRTNATCLYYKPKPGEQILYYDFTSLYPFVNKTKEYPIGHPQIIYQNFGDIKQYFGLVKVKVYPPRNLYFPVLPHKSGGKLMFSLCATCTEKLQTSPCKHSDEERALTGTWCTVELNVALEKGYRIVEIYEIWHFEKTSNELFSGYMNMHLRQKQEASGYPEWCKTDQDKEQYIQDYEKMEGVHLRRDRIEVNPAKRQIAKLFLNSLWGKFGQSTNHLTTSVVTNPEELFKYLFVPYYDVSSCEFVDTETAVVTWKTAKNQPTKSSCTNVFIASFTTAYARLELYRLLEGLGDRCLYHDTDSVIFVSREGAWTPPLGDYLGQLTSEIPQNTTITEFVAAGPKTYAYALSNGEAVVKVKGITLNCGNSSKVNFDSLKDLVDDYCLPDAKRKKEISVEQLGIVRVKKQWTLETRVLRKTLKVVYNKRLLNSEDYCTLPYGY
ncbi:uncharacterized protein LOC116523417 [Thamnophis elegans]|uniref:uncharacterized protein LOC116523417 n=1 Tax=Thamnophis elegans TaxID=35005 RepID=UPI001378C07C|nr:uncharacterized protein LOC116523417 [Thamnophis elegans]